MGILISKLRAYFLLMRLHQPVGFLLLLWPTLWALWVASNGNPSWKLIVLFSLGALLMRSAGCVINDIADCRFDGFVERTKNRPLIIGIINTCEAFLLFFILCLLALLLALYMGYLTLLFGFMGLFIAVIYPFSKRFTYFPQSFLGLAFAWGVPMAFVVQTQTFPPYIAWYMYFITALWVFSYDTIYAMVDREDDRLIGIKSSALFFGNLDRFFIALLQVIILFMLVILGKKINLNFYYYINLLLIFGLFIYQNILIKNRNPKLCFKAFLNNQWVGLLIFLGLVFGLN